MSEPRELNLGAMIIYNLDFNQNPPNYTTMSLFWVFCFVFFFVLFFCLFTFSMPAPEAYGGSQIRGLIGAVAAGLHHSHSNAGSELRLRHTPQLKATPDP